MLQQSTQAETRGEDVANGRILHGQRSLEGFGAVPLLSAFVEDRKRVNDTDDCLTVLAEWGTRKFFDMLGTSWASPDR